MQFSNLIDASCGEGFHTYERYIFIILIVYSLTMPGYIIKFVFLREISRHRLYIIPTDSGTSSRVSKLKLYPRYLSHPPAPFVLIPYHYLFVGCFLLIELRLVSL